MKKQVLLVAVTFAACMFLSLDTVKGVIMPAVSSYLTLVPYAIWLWLALILLIALILGTIILGTVWARTAQDE